MKLPLQNGVCAGRWSCKLGHKRKNVIPKGRDNFVRCKEYEPQLKKEKEYA